MATRETFNVTTTATTNSTGAPHSPWHSPVPYLFGGLAAMLGLIAFALLILACSYWKLSGYSENNETEEGDLETGEGGNGNFNRSNNNNNNNKQKSIKSVVLDEKFLVIMAGELKPTYLATRVCSGSCSTSRSSSFGENGNLTSSEKMEETEKKENDEQVETIINTVPSDQNH